MYLVNRKPHPHCCRKHDSYKIKGDKCPPITVVSSSGDTKQRHKITAPFNSSHLSANLSQAHETVRIMHIEPENHGHTTHCESCPVYMSPDSRQDNPLVICACVWPGLCFEQTLLISWSSLPSYEL